MQYAEIPMQYNIVDARCISHKNSGSTKNQGPKLFFSVYNMHMVRNAGDYLIVAMMSTLQLRLVRGRPSRSPSNQSQLSFSTSIRLVRVSSFDKRPVSTLIFRCALKYWNVLSRPSVQPLSLCNV